MSIKTERIIVYLAGFLFSIPLALTSYINSSALEKFMEPSRVGILYALSAVVTIFFLLELENLLNRFGNRRMTFFASLGFLLALLAMGLSKHVFISSLSFILYFLSSNTLVATLDIFIENFSKNGSVGRLRGMYIATLSIAWVLSQIISGSIIEKSSYSGIYLFSALFMTLVAFIFHFYFRDFKDPKYNKVAIIETLKIFLKDKKLSNAYLTNLILKFFFSWMVIYTPIYLHDNLGLAWDTIGYVFSIMLLPFVLLPYPLGRLSDKIGERKMLALGFTIASFFTAVIPFLETKAVWILAMVLFMTRVGASTIETMSESYFFKVVDEKNADAISFFRNTQAVSYLLAPILATSAFIFIPSFEYLFFILSGILLIGTLISLGIKDVK